MECIGQYRCCECECECIGGSETTGCVRCVYEKGRSPYVMYAIYSYRKICLRTAYARIKRLCTHNDNEKRTVYRCYIAHAIIGWNMCFFFSFRLFACSCALPPLLCFYAKMVESIELIGIHMCVLHPKAFKRAFWLQYRLDIIVLHEIHFA